MITEIARIEIDPAKAADFEAAVAQAEPHFRADKGCTGFALERVVETPGTYHLLVGWTSVEAHMVTFRESPAFQVWRSLASPFFIEPPHVVHMAAVIGDVVVK